MSGPIASLTPEQVLQQLGRQTCRCPDCLREWRSVPPPRELLRDLSLLTDSLERLQHGAEQGGGDLSHIYFYQYQPLSLSSKPSDLISDEHLITGWTLFQRLVERSRLIQEQLQHIFCP